MVFLNSLWEKVLIEQIEQQYRLSAAADASDYLDLAVPHVMNHAIQIKISFYHLGYLVLATFALLLSYIVCHKFPKLSIALFLFYNNRKKVLTLPLGQKVNYL